MAGVVAAGLMVERDEVDAMDERRCRPVALDVWPELLEASEDDGVLFAVA